MAAPREAVFEVLADHAHYDRFDGNPPLGVGESR